MRIPSLLSFAFVIALSSTSCTKADVLPATATRPVEPQFTFGVAYSDWTAASNFMWSANESGLMPFREATWEAPALTKELIDRGSVLVFARTSKGAPVEAMPVMFTTESGSDETDHFYADLKPGAFTVSQSKRVDGQYVMPVESNVSFRYIIITDETPAANGRSRTVADLQAMSYEEVVDVLGIPE